MDSSTGLFYEAGTSVKKESYTIINVLGRVDTQKYIVASSEGVFYFDGSSGTKDVIGTADIAKHAFMAKKGSSSNGWECYYYDETNSKYMIIYQSGKTDEFKGIDASTYSFKSSSFENINGTDYALVFDIKSGNNKGKCAVFYGTADQLCGIDSSNTGSETSPTITETEYTDVSYIGGKVFIGKKDGVVYYFTFNGKDRSDEAVNSLGFRSHLNGYYVSLTPKFYSGTTDITPSSTSGKNYTKCVTYDDATTTYFFLDGASVIYKCSGNTVTTVSISGLSNIEVKAVAGIVDSNYINVITAENGAQCINMADNKIESGSTWK